MVPNVNGLPPLWACRPLTRMLPVRKKTEDPTNKFFGGGQVQHRRSDIMALYTVAEVRLPHFELVFGDARRYASELLACPKFGVTLHLDERRTKTEFVLRRIGGRRGGVGFLCWQLRCFGFRWRAGCSARCTALPRIGGCPILPSLGMSLRWHVRRSCKRVVCDARRRRLEYRVALCMYLCMYDMGYGTNESEQNGPTRRLSKQSVTSPAKGIQDLQLLLQARKETIQRLRWVCSRRTPTTFFKCTKY